MTFALPIFLLAAAAGAIPVALHMINRQRAPVMPFSTLRFLRVSVEKTRRRKYLHDLFLLLLRIAALVLIAVALARPTLTRLRSVLGAKAQSAVVIVLDNSASMSLADQRRKRWPTATSAAERIVDLLREGDSVGVLFTGGPTRSEAGKLFQNHEVIRQAIAAGKLSYEQADLANAIRTARSMLDRADAPNKEIYVVTDMQKLSWQRLKEPLATEQEEETEQIPIVVVDVHADSRPNVAIRKVQLQTIAPAIGIPLQADVELAETTGVAQPCHVQLFIDGKQQSTSPTLSVEPGKTTIYSFQFTINQIGLHRGEVRLVGEDASSLDDRAFFAVHLDPRIPVALVKPRSHEIDYLEDSYYLERALMPAGLGGWAIRAKSLTSASLPAEPLSDYVAVFLVNLPALTPAERNHVVQYVRSGGHVVWVAGDNVDVAAYNAMNEAAEGDLLPTGLEAILTPTTDRPDGWHVGSLDGTHPALAPLVQPASLYQSVLVQKHVLFAPDESSEVRVLARLDDGEPLLVERRVGKGSVMFWGTSVHVDWTNFPLRPVFLPFWAQLTFDFTGAKSGQGQLVAGTPLRIPLPQRDGPVQIEVVHPSGQTIRTEGNPAEQQVMKYADTHAVGTYVARALDAMHPEPMAFSVNLDSAECDARLISQSDLQDQLGETALFYCDDPDELAETIRQMRQGQSLMELFLLGVIIALVAETFVANRLKGQPEMQTSKRGHPRLRRTRHRSQRQTIDV